MSLCSTESGRFVFESRRFSRNPEMWMDRDVVWLVRSPEVC